MPDIVGAIRDEIKSIVSSTLGPDFNELRHDEDIFKNDIRSARMGYAVTAGAGSPASTILGFYTVDQPFNITLTQTVAKTDSSEQRRLKIQDINDKLLDIYNAVHQTKVNAQPNVILVDFAPTIDEPELSDEVKGTSIVSLNMSITIKWRRVLGTPAVGEPTLERVVLSISGLDFFERLASDGVIEDTQTITVSSGTFAVTSGVLVEGVHYTLSGDAIPTSLSLLVTILSATSASISFTGSKDSPHNDSQDFNPTITFLDAAFDGTKAAPNDGSEAYTLNVDFLLDTQVPLDTVDAMIINPGGAANGQYLLGPTGFLSGSTGYTMCMWLKQESPQVTGTVVSITGDEDRAPLLTTNGGGQAAPGGVEDGNRFLFFSSTASSYRLTVYQNTFFNAPAPNVSDNTTSFTSPNTAQWLFVAYHISPASIKLYRSSSAIFPTTWGQEVVLPTTLTALSTHTAPLVIGATRRGPAPRILGTAEYESFDKTFWHSMSFYNGLVHVDDLKKHWNPAADVTSVGNPAQPNPVDPLTVQLTSSPGASLKATWLFADQTYGNDLVFVDRTGNGNDLVMKTTNTNWNNTANRSVNDTPVPP